MSKESNHEQWGIDRRTILQSAVASGIGLVGATGVGGASPGGRPCFKGFECNEEEGTYVKFEFVIETDDGGNIVDCYFEEETETGLIEITHWEDKSGNDGSTAPENADCEPVYVEWEATKGSLLSVGGDDGGLAFGGNDCESFNPEDGSYDSELTNEGENIAAVTNLQFCVVQQVEVGGTVSVGYEDLPLGEGNDYDYNDWLTTVDTTAVGVSTADGFAAQRLELEFVPKARGAIADHRFGVNFPEDTFCEGEYDVSYSVTENISEDDEVTDKQFTPGTDVVIFERTSNVLPELSNTDAPSGCACCVAPDYTATLTIEFDDACLLDIDGFDLAATPHGGNLSYKPFIEVYNDSQGQNGDRIDPTDVRILTVPENWQWPTETTAIWNVYGDADSGTVTQDDSTGEPVFDDAWYTGAPDTSKLADCDPGSQ